MHQHTLFIDIGELRALDCAGIIAIKPEVAAEKVNGLVEWEVEADIGNLQVFEILVDFACHSLSFFTRHSALRNGKTIAGQIISEISKHFTASSTCETDVHWPVMGIRSSSRIYRRGK
jgi:hypothetical protein